MVAERSLSDGALLGCVLTFGPFFAGEEPYDLVAPSATGSAAGA